MVPPIANHPYFVPHQPGTSVSVRDAGDDGVDVDEMPASVDPDDFAPRIVNFVDDSQMTPLERVESIIKTNSMMKTSSRLEEREETPKIDKPKDGMFHTAMEKVFGSRKHREVRFSALDESAKKAAPKLFFAGERTFLQWMHTGILLAGISMAMGSHTETGSVVDWIALLLLPVAIGIMVYGMFQFSKRTYMIASRSPGPYEDRWGPVVVGSVFAFSLLAQFFVVLAKS